MQQLVTFFQLELQGRLVPEDRIRVDARAVEVEDVRAVEVEDALDRVTHVVQGLRGVLEGGV